MDESLVKYALEIFGEIRKAKIISEEEEIRLENSIIKV